MTTNDTSVLAELAKRVSEKHSATASFYSFDPLGHSEFYLSALEWVLKEIEKIDNEISFNKE